MRFEYERDAALRLLEVYSTEEGGVVTVGTIKDGDGFKRVELLMVVIPDILLREMGAEGLLSRFIPEKKEWTNKSITQLKP